MNLNSTHVKVVSYLIGLVFLLSACGGDANSDASEEEITANFSEDELAVLDSANIDPIILNEIRLYTDSSISVLKTTTYAYDESTEEYNREVISHKGISYKASEEGAQNMVLQMMDNFEHRGYQIYISDQNFGYNSDEVTVLKTDDQFEILRVEGIDGTNWGISNEEIIAKLKEWNKKYPFEIVGCGYDFVEAFFYDDLKSKDISAFAQEMYEFCPDIVEQGTGSVKELEKELKGSGILYLWWD